MPAARLLAAFQPLSLEPQVSLRRAVTLPIELLGWCVETLSHPNSLHSLDVGSQGLGTTDRNPKAIYDEPAAAEFVWGMAYHWYGHSEDV